MHCKASYNSMGLLYHHRNLGSLFVLLLCLVSFCSNHLSPQHSRNLQESKLSQNGASAKIVAEQQIRINSVPITPNILYPISNMIVPTHKLIIKSQQIIVNGMVIDTRTTTVNAGNSKSIDRSAPNLVFITNRPPLQIQTPVPAVDTSKMQKQVPFYCWSRPTTTAPAVFTTREKLVATNYGFNMYVDSLDGTVSSTITYSGTWEPNYISLIGTIVKPGNSVMNLGSQSGLEALVMGKIVGPTGKLFIFEPYSFSNKLVTKNIQLNNLTSITTVYKVGASDEKSTAEISVSYWNTGGSEITPIRSKNLTKEEQGQMAMEPQGNEIQIVQIDLVDNMLPQEATLDFALLDVEKMEIKALRGMRKVIERSPRLVIMTEWQYAQNPRKNEQETMEFLTWMIGRGYRIYSYSGGTIWNCRLGSFQEYTNPRQLLGLNFLDIFFFPSDVPLPK